MSTLNSDLLTRLESVIKRGLVQFSDIKSADYSAAIMAQLNAEVGDGTITAAQYKTYTGTDYMTGTASAG